LQLTGPVVSPDDQSTFMNVPEMSPIDLQKSLDLFQKSIQLDPNYARAFGELASTFEWLERAYSERVFRLIELTLPMFDGLRSSPQWHDLMRRVGLQD